MKVALALLAVLAVALARPQDNGRRFWPETLERAQQRQFVLPHERLLDFQEAPLVNFLENVPFDQQVPVERIVVPLQAVQVYPHLQRSIDSALATL